MSSLTSVATVSGFPKLESASGSATSSAIDKSTSISYERSHLFTRLDSSSDALYMINYNTEVEPSCYIPLLERCIDENSVTDAEIVHGHIIKTGTYRDLDVMTFLLNVYAKCGTTEFARTVFDNLPIRNVVAWTTLITGYVRNSRPDLAIRTFLEMLRSGAYPSNFTLGIVVNACISLQSLNLGKQIHAYIIKYQIEQDTSIGNALCNLYSKHGSLVNAMTAFEKIREKNVISWTSIISACGDNGDAARGLRCLSEMLLENVQPNEYTLTSAFSLCSTMLSLHGGAQIHSLCIKLGYESRLSIRNSLIYLYFKCGCVDEARKLFDGMENKSLITWNALIAGHAQMMETSNDYISTYHTGLEALNIFLKLNRSRFRPDLYTFSSILTVCCSLAALEQGEQIHAQAIKTGFIGDVVVGTSLVNMYNKCGCTKKASKAFVEMSMRTLISWTAMITGFSQNGQFQQALQLFDDMRLAGVRPNQIAFVAVLSACCHAGMVREALGYFEMMQREYRIKPVMDHYTCLIQMFVRLGRLDEAFELLKNMEFEPSEFIWFILITGCTDHGKSELGFIAAEQLMKLKPKDVESYTSLLRLYISAEKWDDVSRVKKLIRDVEKSKDWSWISIKSKIYSFKSSDQLHTGDSETCRLLESLIEKARSVGYEPSLDVTDEEISLSPAAYHSEKLAIAFGLLNTPNAAPIRVSKSICMCIDCHNFVKCVSILTSLEFTVRDSRGLHKFVNGRCSCGDYGCLL